MTPFELQWLLICMYGFPIILTSFFGVIIAWIIWEFWVTPKESKQIRDAKRKKTPLAILATDEGYIEILPLPIRGSEGYFGSDKKQKKRWIGFTPKEPSILSELMEHDEDKNKEETEKTSKLRVLISELVNKKSYFRYAKIPVLFGVYSKAILTSIYSIAGLQTLETEASKSNPGKFTAANLGEAVRLFGKHWDQTLQRNQEVKARMEGELEAKKWAGKEPIILLLALCAVVCVLGILLVVAAHLL